MQGQTCRVAFVFHELGTRLGIVERKIMERQRRLAKGAVQICFNLWTIAPKMNRICPRFETSVKQISRKTEFCHQDTRKPLQLRHRYFTDHNFTEHFRKCHRIDALGRIIFNRFLFLSIIFKMYIIEKTPLYALILHRIQTRPSMQYIWRWQRRNNITGLF